jgi:hypothetical protein
VNRRTALALIAIVAALLAIAVTASAQTDPPASGDWTVDDNSFWDTDLALTGNLTVNNSGSLKLENMTLTMTGAKDGALTIFVEAGSTLEVINTNIRSSNADIHFWFEARGKVVFDGADVQDLASSTDRWDSWDRIEGGVQIYDNSSVIRNSVFHDSQRINMYVSGVSPDIINCEFNNAEYMSTYSYYGYSMLPYFYYVYGYFLDATGLYLYESNSNITSCKFRNNGRPQTALPYYSTSYSPNVVQTFGRGILAADSSPNITLCEFQQNGDQPGDRRVDGVDQVFLEPAFYDYRYAPEGGLVCIGTSHPIVVRSNFYTNDLFGIFGYDGGYPDVVEACHFEGNRYLRDTSVLSPSAAIQVDGGSGTMLVANSTASANLVLANIYLDQISLHLVNFRNSANSVTNAYNIFLAGGKHVFEDCFLDGRPGLGTNVYVSYSRSGASPKLKFENCTLLGAEYAMYVQNSGGTQVTFANSTLREMTQGTFYLYSTNVDCIDCDISPLRVDSYSWGRGSTVRIMYYLSINVSWQNGKKVSGAFVQVFNASKEFVYGGIADENGTIGPIVVAYKTILASSGGQTEFTNSPLHMSAYSAGLTSQEYKQSFTQSITFAITIWDRVEPTIYVFTPVAGHAQNGTFLEVRGMCTDVGAGINSTYVSLDGVNWVKVGGAEQTWQTDLELTEGRHDIHIKAVDEAGNEAFDKIESIVIDLTPPALEVLDPVKATWFTSSINYTIRGRVNGEYTLIINRQKIEVAPDGTWESTHEIHSGSNEFSISAIDHVGNVYMVHKTIIRDSTVPKLILTSPEAWLWTNISQIEVKGITELGATVRVNGEPIQTFDGRFATNIFLTEGANNVVVEAVDKANNIIRVERTVYLDSIPPLLRVESPRADALVHERYLPVMGTIDDPSVNNVIINGLLVPVEDQAFYKEFRLDEGENPIVIEIWDGARNYATRSYMIILDTTPPHLELQEPGLYLETREPTVSIRGRVDADVELFIWGEPLHEDFDIINLVRLETIYRYDQYPLVLGVNTIHLEAEDDVGNTAVLTLVVIYDLEAPKLMISPMVDKTTDQVVTVSGILLDGDELRINGVPGVLGPNGEFTESVHLQKGKNAIKVVAFDAAGNRVEDTVNVTRTAVEPPAEGIVGAGIGLSILLVLVMMGVGLAIIYPGIKGGTIEPEGMVGEPIIIDESGLQVPPPWDAPAEAPSEHPPPRSPPRPPSQGETEPRPLPPPPPEEPRQPGVPPKPPWRD